MVLGPLKLPPRPPTSTERLPSKALATARSGSWSALKSPVATELEKKPVAKLVGPEKLPAAPPSSTETLLEKRLATARSGSLSALKSPVATETGLLPAAKLVGAEKLTGAWDWASTAPGARNKAASRVEPIRTARRRDRM